MTVFEDAWNLVEMRNLVTGILSWFDLFSFAWVAQPASILVRPNSNEMATGANAFEQLGTDRVTVGGHIVQIVEALIRDYSANPFCQDQ